MAISQKTIPDFITVLASKEPVPGGGGASALVGAVGVALGNMAGSLTIGKKKYADVEADIVVLGKRSDALQDALLALIDKDALDFEPLAKAYGLPTDTPEQQAEKDRVMETASRVAAAAPLEIMRKCAEGIDIIEGFAAKGSKLAISDAGVGVIFCKAALSGASLNVFVNTKAMKDRSCAEKINKEAETLLAIYEAKADKIFALVKGQLRSRQESR
ncbi:MAG: cyclodeaminase/cyclohydrolase family protein [Spirochaetaceae bacterium]|jgi:formiminotetrahydrofolate cyclodeaminase|nr:cyclodeaminase/cyclohydrolase family protein [Spirochaetaceae bacterium]